MIHQVKDFKHLIGHLPGMTDRQVETHLGLYAGYVKKLNEIQDKLKTVDPVESNYTYGAFSELKRRETVAFNGSYLHQAYFENMTAQTTEQLSQFRAAIEASWGTWEKFVADIKGSAASTPGWVVLTKNKIDGMLHTYIMYEHNVNFPIHNNVLLALDCWEHAFAIDYGTDKAKYVDNFLKVVDWQVVAERFVAVQ
ncbi:MAG: Fe-Mn family superoxide dismutase [Patescibacteria group bacterium]|jgi:Fe-Mn family superoxide dismutase